ncbi:hypothetical protein BH09BAC6_BH09BAC6_22280 [soil metagenome]|jgi:hypothetical protein
MMKNSTKLIAAAFTAAAIFFGSAVKAQTTPENKFRLGVGLELGAPTGNAHNISNFELGGTARLQYGVSKNLALTVTSGYYNMFGKTGNYTVNGVPFTGKAADLGIVPLKAGVKAFFADNLYFGAEVGAGFETVSNGNTKLIVSPALGFANKTWDVGVRYENFSGQSNSYGLVGLRIAYGFAL